MDPVTFCARKMRLTCLAEKSKGSTSPMRSLPAARSPSGIRRRWTPSRNESACTKKEGGATVLLQLDRALFENEADFRSAFGPEVEALNDPGLAANYQAGSGDSGATHIGVLLNKDGDSFNLRVSGTTKTRAEMKRAASAITDRY